MVRLGFGAERLGDKETKEKEKEAKASKIELG